MMDGKSMMSGGGSWVLPAVLLGVLLVLVLVVGYLLLRGRLASARPPGRAAEQQRRLAASGVDGEDRPLSILRARYARGEIEVDEYEQRLAPLLRDHSTPGHP